MDRALISALRGADAIHLVSVLYLQKQFAGRNEIVLVSTVLCDKILNARSLGFRKMINSGGACRNGLGQENCSHLRRDRILIAIALLALGQRPGAGRNHPVMEINRPVAQVFPWLLDPDKMKRWIPGLTEAVQLTPGPVTVGTRARDVMVLDNETTVLNVEITAMEPDKLLTARLEADGFTIDIRYELTAHDAATRLEYNAVAHYNSWLAGLMEPVITAASRKKLDEDLVKLKLLVESQ